MHVGPTTMHETLKFYFSQKTVACFESVTPFFVYILINSPASYRDESRILLIEGYLANDTQTNCFTPWPKSSSLSLPIPHTMHGPRTKQTKPVELLSLVTSLGSSWREPVA